MPIRLIASDLDGTLLHSDLSISPRTRNALDAARAAGIHIVPVTARQPEGVRWIAEAAGFDEWALCSNGALGVHLTTGQVLFETHIAADVQRQVAQALAERVPGILFVSVREAGKVFMAQDGYAAISTLQDHKRDPATMGAYTLDEVLAQPSLKFVARHPSITPPELLAELRGLNLTGVHATHSGAPFLEMAAQGVSKAWGLAQLCRQLGIGREEVLAFGDAPNDAEMLAWAGRGVAMGNADAEAHAVADEVTLTNNEDGVATVIEQVLGVQV